MSTAAKPLSRAAEPDFDSKMEVPWATIAWFGALLVLCYLPILIRLVRQWNNDEDMGHGFFVPVIAGYIAWTKREELLRLPFRQNMWGLALVLFAALQAYIGTLGAELFLARTAFLEALAGSILFLGGTQVLRALAFPLGLLVLMIPIPGVLYN